MDVSVLQPQQVGGGQQHQRCQCPGAPAQVGQARDTVGEQQRPLHRLETEQLFGFPVSLNI